MRKLPSGIVFALVALMTFSGLGLPSPAVAQDAASKECLTARTDATRPYCNDPDAFFAPIIHGEIDGFVTISDDEEAANEAAAYCIKGYVSFVVLPHPAAPDMIPLAPHVPTKCDESTFQRDFPGSEMVVNFDEHDGWVIGPDGRSVSMCWNGTRLRAWPDAMNLMGGIPELRSPDCAPPRVI